MNPPITHYRDEVPEQTQDVLNKELEKETQKKIQNEQTPELKVLPVQKQEKKPTNASNIVNAFRQKMASNYNTIELPSIGKTLEFKDISTKEQKEMSKIAMESDSRADLMYCTMVSLINNLSVDKKFDIRDYTEFERIALTLNIQQMNRMGTEIKFTCPKCGKENSYKVDTPKLLRNFNKSYKPDETIEIDFGDRKFKFIAGWPNVRKVEEFFKNYYKKYDNLGEKVKETVNNMSQIEYVTMFVKSVTVSEASDPEDTMTANLDELTYPERVQIIDCLPQSVLFDENTGVMPHLVESFITPLNHVFKYQDCAYCGAEQEGTMANVTDFLGY